MLTYKVWRQKDYYFINKVVDLKVRNTGKDLTESILFKKHCILSGVFKNANPIT